MQLLGAASANAATYKSLRLLNGWTNAPFGTASPDGAEFGG
jgi:hypothetical protein